MGTKAYACYNVDEEVRRKSSSGGIFFALAKWTISQGGIVCGAKFDENWNVIHDYSDTMEGVISFLQSKYVQSSMQNLFSKVKLFLESGRLVLFSGTPCQIAGLKSFLGKNFKKLITVDFVCHGVPSQNTWKEYLSLRSNGRKISNIYFRDKTEGWQKFSLKIVFSDGSIYRQPQQKDLYMKGFLQDIYLRPSCYSCRFKGLQRDVDITLADLWGVWKMHSELFDDKGISLVLVHSEYGMKLWNIIMSNIVCQELTSTDYLKFNPNIMTSVSRNKKMYAYQKKKTWKNLKKITSESYTHQLIRILRKSKRLLLEKGKK